MQTLKNKKLKKLDIKINKLVNSLFFGNYKAAFKGRGMEFSDFRIYEDGDDIKNIDWLVSAREGKTFVRRYEEERDLTILFLLDISDSMNFGLGESTKIDLLEEIFYLLAFSAVSNNDNVGAILSAGDGFLYMNPKKGKGNIINIFNKIEELKNLENNSNDFSIAIKYLNSLKIKNSLVFIITDKMNIDDKELKISSIKNHLVFVNIFHSFENTLEGVGGEINLVDMGDNLMIDLRDKEKKKIYKDYRRKKIEDFKRKLSKYNIDNISLDEKSNIIKELINFFKKVEGKK